MTNQIFAYALGAVVLGLGIVFLRVARKTTWNAIDAWSLRINPIRRWMKNTWPTCDAVSLRAGRIMMSLVGLIAVVTGIAILLSAALTAG